MFDEFARQLLDRLPEFVGLDRVACRRALSAAYAQVVEIRLRGAANPAAIEPGTRRELRRMVDTLESVAVFDPLAGVAVPEDMIAASAFAAAEALSLLTALPVEPGVDAPDAIRGPVNYCAMEAGLLYLIGGYDINASASVKRLPVYAPGQLADLEAATVANAAYLVSRIQALCSGDVRPPPHLIPSTGYTKAPSLCEDILLECRLRCYEQLADALNAYLEWLRVGGDILLQRSQAMLAKVRLASRPPDHPGFTALADIHHLASLLLAAVQRTSTRSVLHRVPVPSTEDEGRRAEFRRYLVARITGTHGWRGRPFLWPSAQDFVRQCMPGPRADAVIAMPTGSGKSFVAELAIADALTRGSVIYLAPTNALVHQIRRDLKDALAEFAEVEMLAFIGGDEYSAGLDNFLGVGTRRFVAVMTPEKCALALRLAPEAFAELKLCVFDECHLLSDRGRGVIVDLLLAQLFTAAPDMNFLLMSAMISNPEDLAGWLATARGSVAVQSAIKWRPSRTLRGVIGVNREAAQTNGNAALTELVQRQAKHPSRVNQPFTAPLVMLAGLSGPWNSDAEADYRLSPLPAEAGLTIVRRKGNVTMSTAGWCNDATLHVSQALARADIPVIAFVLQNRNWAFTLAAQVATPLRDAQADLPMLVLAYLAIAQEELGVASELAGLFARGVAVHTSLMLPVEQSAAEFMFRGQHAKLMFATPTLAQGLNLPAIAVVISGTSLGGGSWGQDPDDNHDDRVKATILNSFGRAGRPGFANQGVALLVPDNPVWVTGTADVAGARAAYPVLTSPDAAVAVTSPIESFLDRAYLTPNTQLAATQVELELVTSLAESPVEDDAAKILRRTFAGYRRREQFTELVAASVRDRIAQLKTDFLAEAGIPAWLNLAAAQAGIDVFRARQLWLAYTRRGLGTEAAAQGYTVEGWFASLIGIMSELPPARLKVYLDFQESLKAGELANPPTILHQMRNAVNTQRALDTMPWEKPAGWDELWQKVNVLVWSFMGGSSYAELHPLLCDAGDIEFDGGRAQGKPIPRLLNALKDLSESLAKDAGCVVALHEHTMRATAGEDYQVPDALAALPLCIRNGCDSLKTLAFFRTIYRQRICAHRFADNFEMPAELTTENERNDWVRRIKRLWLEDGYPTLDADPILGSAKIIVTDLRE